MPIPDSDFSVKRLESLAVAQRLDLRAAHRDLTSIVFGLGLTGSIAGFPCWSSDSRGNEILMRRLNMGPSFRIELPIFNQGQSRIARGKAQLRRAENGSRLWPWTFVRKHESCVTGS